MDANATSFTSQLAQVRYAAVAVPSLLEPLVDAVSRASIWTVLFTLLAVAVVYDQSMFDLAHTPAAGLRLG